MMGGSVGLACRDWRAHGAQTTAWNAQGRGCCLQGCALHPLRARATAEARATATAIYPWDGGVGPVAGDAVNPSMGAWPRHPCRGHSRNRTHPAFDSFPRTVGDALGVRSVFRRKTDLTPDRFRYLTEKSCRPRSTPTNSREDLSEVGRCGWAGPLAPWMAPSSPHGWVYGVSCPPTPPRPPTDSRCCCCFGCCFGSCTCFGGCRAQPCRTPQMSVGASPYCSAKRLLKLAAER